MATVRVSGVQMEVSRDLTLNLKKILDFLTHNDSEFMVFPEMALTGYHGDFCQDETEQAWQDIASACRKTYTTAIIGTGCRDDGRTHIQSRIISDEGVLIGTHEKLVPTKEDRKVFAPGEELRVFSHMGLEFGCLICNDLWVTPGCGPYPDPRLSFQLSQRGAQLIFHSINSGSSEMHTAYHESNLKLRALEAGIHIVTANAAVPHGDVNAMTGIVSPEGEWLVHAPRTGEHLVGYDIEVETE